MKTLVVYATTHGCTEKCATILANHLPTDTKPINLKETPHFDLSNFDTIIIGGSIHAGKMQKAVKKFCANNLMELKQKKLGLFICCMEEGEKAKQQFKEAFPKELLEQAVAKGYFGGEFNFEKMNFIERSIIKKIAKVDESISKISEENIAEFASKIANLNNNMHDSVD